MNTAQMEQWISGYIDGELSASENAQVEALLAQDPLARRIQEDYLRIRNAFLRAMESPQPKLPTDFRARIIAKANRRAAGTPTAWSPSSFWKRLSSPRVWAFPLAAVCIALMVTAYSHRPADTDTGGRTVAVVSEPQIEQPGEAPMIAQRHTNPDWIAPPPMPGTETIVETLTPEAQRQKAADTLLAKGVEFICRPSDSADSADIGPFENRLLSLLSDRDISWQKSMRGKKPQCVYEISMTVGEMESFLKDIATQAEESGWTLEPATDSLNPSLDSIPFPDRKIKVRFVFQS